ncbi:hypothetical protein [Massilia sp. ST3]|uniref:hypothetical protein n=1 Tax=Massilia sp. ST3 TaxID=2824903 RepID=UPI001B8291DC|nr:hypothetical protein [Massilia sp. ST3]MBQ5948799.1 hypothetical protein [Massilia sp. ST3]
MFGSTVLEVAIGLAFCYGTLALVVSTLQEALAAAFSLRAGMLQEGIKRMLADPRFDALARMLYAHPLVNPQGAATVRDGAAGGGRPPGSRPSYIDPRHFAMALVDTIRHGEMSVGAAIAGVDDPQLRRTLQALYAHAGGDLQRFQDCIADWFDSAMERLSGVYKRRQLLVSWLLALLLAILFNIDSIHLFRTLWQHPVLAAQIGAAPGALDTATLQQLWALPIGWNSFPPTLDARFALQAAGWLVTASTTLFGAPFWFDLLQRAINLRSTGAKPASSQAAADERVPRVVAEVHAVHEAQA